MHHHQSEARAHARDIIGNTIRPDFKLHVRGLSKVVASLSQLARCHVSNKSRDRSKDWYLQRRTN